MENEKPRLIRRTNPVVNEVKEYSDEIEDHYKTGKTKTDNGYAELISDSIVELEDFLKEKFPHRLFIIDPWLRQGNIVLIFAPKGTGKTFFAATIATAVTRGLSIGEWKKAEPVNCLYYDGEMACEEFQERMTHLTKNLTPARANFQVLSYERMRMRGKLVPYLGEKEWRDHLFLKLKHDRSIKLLILDNLASITPRISESSKRQWDDINQWLLSLRAIGVAVIMLHHTGKNGEQRGTSAREDNIDISISLTRPKDYRREDGAKFMVNFEKSRSIFGDKVRPFCMEIVAGGVGKLPWKTSNDLADNVYRLPLSED